MTVTYEVEGSVTLWPSRWIYVTRFMSAEYKVATFLSGKNKI